MWFHVETISVPGFILEHRVRGKGGGHWESPAIPHMLQKYKTPVLSITISVNFRGMHSPGQPICGCESWVCNLPQNITVQR